MSTSADVDSETITQADGAQSSRVPVPLPDDPYVAADESQPLGSRVPFMSEEFKASEPSSTRTISSHSPVSSDSTIPLSPDHLLTHVSPTPTPTQVSFHPKAAALSPSSFRKREEDTEEDKEDESSDANDDREGQGLNEEGQGFEDEGPATSEPLGLGYGAAWRRVLKSIDEISPSTYKVGQSSRSVPERAGAERIYAFRQPTLVTWLDLEDGRVYTDILTYAPPVIPVQTPLSPERDVRELYTRLGAVRDEIFSQGYRLRSLERQNDAQRAALWHAIYDTKRENHDLRMQLAEERHERLELANRVARLERIHESKEE
nr:hypothetical protein [Tanacetum cinerariifolium]